jgi:hypothetical protein
MVDETYEVAAPAADPAPGAALSVLLLLLKTLGKRTLIALAALFDLALCASVFYIYLIVLEAPSTLHLVGSGMYAVFTLAVLFSRRKG